MSEESDLRRYLTAQDGRGWMPGYAEALAEIRNGQKTSHWIWYVFPQIGGLSDNPSKNSAYYAISGLAEAGAYLAHPVLGARLREISEAVLSAGSDNARHIMGSGIDKMKLQSCMTLFELVSAEDTVFSQVLDRLYHGERDSKTLRLLHLK